MNFQVTEEMVKEKIQLKNCELLGICVCLVPFYLPETAGSSVSIETRKPACVGNLKLSPRLQKEQNCIQKISD